ncbi:MAG: hypothetical protein KF812_13275, partial [Fimbriimonadaceae bacterium]|nr:hypothetical protein [Fimbriimonadaceae bacterium]
RMYDLSIGEKYLKERYRKFTERLNGDDFRAKWPHFAQRMAYLAWTDPDNPPEQVNLRRHFKEWVQPYVDDGSDYKEVTFYRHAVNVSELREWKGW